MKHNKIFSILVITAGMGCAQAMGSTPVIERLTPPKPAPIERQAAIQNRLHSPVLNYACTGSERSHRLSAAAAPRVIFEHVPTGNSLSYKCECSVAGSSWSASTITDKNDGYVNVKCMTNQQAAEATGKQDDWLWIPASITFPNAKLTFTGKVSNSYRNAPQNFDIVLCSAESKQSVIAKLCEYNDVDVPEGATTPVKEWFFKLEGSCIGPAEPGEYYLAIHVKESADKKWANSNLNFGDFTLIEEATEPVTGPNGELFELHPSEQEFNNSTVIDANKDGSTIVYNVRTSEIDGTFFDWPLFYDNSEAMGDADEWFITTPVEIRHPELKHTVSIEAMALATSSIESFEIAIGTAPTVEGMSKIIMEQPAVTNNGGAYSRYTSNFAVTESGLYYIGIHIKSRRDKGWRIVLRDLVVCQTEQSSLLPDVCTDIAVTPDRKGDSKVTAEFTLPVRYLNETDIPTDEDITVTVTTSVDSKTVTGKPGENKIVELEAIEGGNLINFTSSNERGEGNTISGYAICGLDRPSNPVVSAEISDDNMSATLKWTLPTLGANGGIVDPDGVTYSLYVLAKTEGDYTWQLMDSNISTDHTQVNAPTERQDIYNLMVSATNSKGESIGGMESAVSLVLGKPYQLPMKDDFEGNTFLGGLNLAYPAAEYGALWALDNPTQLDDDAADENSCALMCVSQTEGVNKGQLWLPKFTPIGSDHTRVALTIFCYPGMASTDVYLQGIGDPYKLGTIDSHSGQGWTEIYYDVPESYKDSPWLYIICDITINNPYQYFMLDKYEAYTRLRSDFNVKSARLNSDARLLLGEPVSFEAEIENRGYENQPFPEVQAIVLDGGTVLEKIRLDNDAIATLGDAQSAIIAGSVTINKADYANKDLTLRIEITTADGDLSNNTLDTKFRLFVPEGPIVDDLYASSAGSDVYLGWSDPYQEGYKETFESLGHGTHATYLGEWKNIDFDGRTPYAMGNYPVPDGTMPKAFQALDVTQLGLDGFPIPSGVTVLNVICAEGAQSDDWLISPKLKDGSTLSFWVAALSSDYTETLEILYSTTSNEPDDFQVLETLTVSAPEWRKVSFILPEDALYVALHYASHSQFGLFIDDLVYAPLNPLIEITGFNVYRNDKLILSDVKDTECFDQNPEPGRKMEYNVTAIGLTNGIEKEYPMSNSAYYIATGMEDVCTTRYVAGGERSIRVIGFEGSVIAVYNVSGIMVADIAKAMGEETIAVEPGVYVVNIGAETYKVIVK